MRLASALGSALASALGSALAWIEAVAARHPRRLDRIALVAIALVAAVIVWAFAAAVLWHTRPMALPVDDSFRYLAAARQIGRGQIGPLSAGPSALWPMVLAAVWAVGARGEALVWAAFVASAVLYAAAVLGVYRVTAALAGWIAGVAAALIALGAAAFAWGALAGLEVALVAALLVALARQLMITPARSDAGHGGDDGPSRRLAVCLAAVSLASPEAALVAILVAGAAAVRRSRGDRRAAVRWLVPLAPLAVWLVASRIVVGHWLPAAYVARSWLAEPGDGGWVHAVATQIGPLLRGLFWDGMGALVWPRLLAVLWLAGAVRVLGWARREQRWPAAGVILGAPLVVMLGAAASSGPWSGQNFRLVAPALPLLAIPVGCALGPLARAPRALRWAHAVAAIALAAGFVHAAGPRVVADARLFAQGAVDVNAQLVAIGDHVHRKLPEARVLVPDADAGAIAYSADGAVFDVAGIPTARAVEIDGQGPGVRFELLDGLPPEQRFTHLVVSPGWLGTSELYGELVFPAQLRPRFEPRRLAIDAVLQLLPVAWDRAGSGERPLYDHTGWTIVDRIDVADLASEAAHDWIGTLGQHGPGDPATRWSVVGREAGARGLVLDGGRTIRGGERFTIARDPARPVRLILRSGGARSYPDNEVIDRPVALRILDDAGRELARGTVPAPPPDASFVEVAFALPAGATEELRTDAPAPYRAFHWFVLQPE